MTLLQHATATAQQLQSRRHFMSHDLTTTAGKIADFRDRQASAEQPSGPEAIEKQHARGKNTARERIDLLVDAGSFVEFDALAVHRSTAFGMEKKKPLGDGVVSGSGVLFVQAHQQVDVKLVGILRRGEVSRAEFLVGILGA